MKDDRGITIVEHSELEGVIHWCDRAWALSIPGLPELGLFPAQISCHYGASKAERPYLKRVIYFPDLRSLRHDPDAAGFRMTYRSVYDGRSRIILTAAADGSQWRAEKFVGRREIGLAIGRPGDQFFLHFSLVPIPEDEKCFTRDWPAEEIAALTSSRLSDPARGRQEEIWDIPMFCRKILDSVQRAEGLGRAEAASILCETLMKEASKDAPN